MLKEIAEHLGLTLVQIEPNDRHCKANGQDVYENRSYIAGKNIELGIYENNELKIASFFHEVGHTLIHRNYPKRVKYNTRKIEALAWKKGFKLAAYYEIYFNDKVKEWAKQQILTYNE